MTSITLTDKSLATIPQKYCRVELTEESASKHRFIESADGILTYRMGAGKWNEITERSFRTLVRTIVQAAKSHQIENLVLALPQENFSKLVTQNTEWYISTIVENILLASYEFTTYKSKQKEYVGIKEVVLICAKTKEVVAGYKRGLIVAEQTNIARDIANTHGDDLTPKALAKKAQSLAKGTKVNVKVLSRKDILKENMRLLNAVGKGSHNEEQFIIMEYWGKENRKEKIEKRKVRDDEQPIVLIGKGITYDTGGLNVKPAGYMHDMHMDMSGGSSIMVAIIAAAKLGLKKNIIALIPTAENAISSTSMRAGDIVTSRSGQTVEVLHTDAEGRMVLADALTYSEQYKPRVILDVATLTGAALVALGQQASAVMTKDTDLEKTLRDIGEDTGDLVWPLPLWDEYKGSLKSNRADISNVATNFSKFGGCIEGGTFLSHFAPKNVPWAHIDIAPRMESIASDKLAKGSTGEPVRLLIKFLETY
jgi:leucyl aminopeptidase